MNGVETATARPSPPSRPDPTVRRWRAWGTAVAVAVADPGLADSAAAMVRTEIAAMDQACNRFRWDSELARLNRAAGRRVRISPLMADALRAALLAAEHTDGAVDPTVGGTVAALGYDRDYDELAVAAPWLPLRAVPGPVPGWQSVELDEVGRTARVPGGVHLDLGATAKALCADRAADRIAGALGCGIAVDLGGDVAMAGAPPDGGWTVAVMEDGRSGSVDRHCVVAITGGGLASSGTTVRTWRRAGRTLHHIVDPSTGWPADPVWRLVTVAAGSCVDANTASTAAVVWGEDAPFRLAQLDLPSRLVGRDGSVLEVGGWPRCTVGGSPATTPGDAGTAR